MSRYYAPIEKEEFLAKVKELMRWKKTEEEYAQRVDLYPNNLSKAIEKDLAKVEFCFENFSMFEDQSRGHFQIGHFELAPGFHIFIAYGGGDWESAVHFVYYWDGTEIRAYIPKEGNAYCKVSKAAYGSCVHDEHYGDNSYEMNLDMFIADVERRIKKRK